MAAGLETNLRTATASTMTNASTSKRDAYAQHRRIGDISALPPALGIVVFDPKIDIAVNPLCLA